MPAPSTHPAQPARRVAERHAALLALCALLLATGCGHRPPANPEATAPAPLPAALPAGSKVAPVALAPITVVAVREVYRTQQVDRVVRERCGERIAAPPEPSLWSRMFSPKPSDDGDVPAPVFAREIACDPMLASRLQPARYRVVYSLGAEDYAVDLDYDPGAAVFVDAAGHVLGPAPSP